MAKPKKAILIEPDGHVRALTVQTLEDLQAAVGGYIEGVNLGEDCGVLVNEDGKVLRLPVNTCASAFAWDRGLPRYNCIRGNMLILGPVDRWGNYTNVRKKFLELVNADAAAGTESA